MNQILKLILSLLIIIINFNYSSVIAIKNLSDYSTIVSAIRTKIFNGYDPMAYPVINYTRPITVRMYMRLLNFAVNAEENLIDFHSFFRIEWSDPYLKWNLSEFGGVKRINVRMDDVFTPDIILYNSIKPTNMMKHFNYSELIITNNGIIYWTPLLRMKSICQFDFYDWPNDQQNCSLIFISWSYPYNAMALYISSKSINLHDLWPNNQWKIINTTCDTLIVTDIPGREDLFFPGVQYTIILSRRSTLSSYSYVIISTIIMNIISLSLSFQSKLLIHIRLHLNILTFITLLLIAFYLANALSMAKFATTRLVKYISIMLITTSLLMFWSTISLNIIESSKIYDWLWLDKIEQILRWCRLIIEQYDVEIQQNHRLVIIIDRLLLIIYLIIIIIAYYLF